jgi:hypothetical protein
MEKLSTPASTSSHLESEDAKPSLVCDLQELYRHLIDDFLIRYCRTLKKKDFTTKAESVSKKRKGRREYLNGMHAWYLEKHGEGLFHLAFESSNISQTIRDFEEAGIPVAGTTPTKEVLSFFLHPKFAHGVLIQVLKKGVFDNSGRISGEVIAKEGG